MDEICLLLINKVKKERYLRRQDNIQNMLSFWQLLWILNVFMITGLSKK